MYWHPRPSLSGVRECGAVVWRFRWSTTIKARCRSSWCRKPDLRNGARPLPRASAIGRPQSGLPANPASWRWCRIRTGGSAVCWPGSARARRRCGPLPAFPRRCRPARTVCDARMPEGGRSEPDRARLGARHLFVRPVPQEKEGRYGAAGLAARGRSRFCRVSRRGDMSGARSDQHAGLRSRPGRTGRGGDAGGRGHGRAAPGHRRRCAARRELSDDPRGRTGQHARRRGSSISSGATRARRK